MGLLLTPEETAPPPELVVLSRAGEDIIQLISASHSAVPPPVPPPVRPRPAYYPPQRKSG